MICWSPVAQVVVIVIPRILQASRRGRGGIDGGRRASEISNRPGIAYLEVRGLPPSEFAIVWRRDDHREVIRDAADIACAVATDAG